MFVSILLRFAGLLGMGYSFLFWTCYVCILASTKRLVHTCNYCEILNFFKSLFVTGIDIFIFIMFIFDNSYVEAIVS